MTLLLQRLRALADSFGRQIDDFFALDAFEWDWVTSDSVPAGADRD